MDKEKVVLTSNDTFFFCNLNLLSVAIHCVLFSIHDFEYANQQFNFISYFSVTDYCEVKEQTSLSHGSALSVTFLNQLLFIYLKWRQCISFFRFHNHKSKEKRNFLRERKDWGKKKKKKKKENLQGMPVLPLTFFPQQFVANGTAGQNCELWDLRLWGEVRVVRLHLWLQTEQLLHWKKSKLYLFKVGTANFKRWILNVIQASHDKSLQFL